MQQARPHEVEQALGKLRERVVELFPYAGGKKRKALEQPFHVRVAVSHRVDIEKLGPVRMRLCEFPAGFIQVTQFFLVIFFDHGLLRLSSRARWTNCPCW